MNSGDKVRIKDGVSFSYKSVQRAFEQANYYGIVGMVDNACTPPAIKVRAVGSIEWDMFQADELERVEAQV